MLAARPDLDACVGQILPTDADGNPQGPPYPADLPADGDVFEAFLNRWPQIGALVVRASVRDTVGYLDESLISSEDWDWQLRIALRHRIGHAPVTGLMFRSRPDRDRPGGRDEPSAGGVNRRVFWKNVWRGRAHRLVAPLGAADGAALRRRLRRYFLKSGAAHAAAGERAAARRSLLHAVTLSPLHVAAWIARRPSTLSWIAWTFLGWTIWPV